MEDERRTPPAGRRWSRFSLRTLFVLTTLVGCGLGWELSSLRERRSLLQQFETRGGYQFTTAASFAPNWPAPAMPPAAPSRLRRLLGDEPVYTIWYPPDLAENAAELGVLRRAFPEAELRQTQYEPCHPGCFPAGTAIETPLGPRPVEAMRPGDLVLTVAPGGQLEAAAVESVFTTDNQLLRIDLECGPLFTTAKQPLCLRSGVARPAGQLVPGDQVLRWANGALGAERVVAVADAARTERVFNLVLGGSQLFVANGVLARSKPPIDR